jgi:hypothetical protein
MKENAMHVVANPNIFGISIDANHPNLIQISEIIFIRMGSPF